MRIPTSHLVLITAACFCLALTSAALAQTTQPASPGAPAPGASGGCHALLITGLPGSPVYAERFHDWTKRFHTHLTVTAKVPAQNIVVLSGDDGFKDPIVRGKATTEGIKQTLSALAAKVRRQDQFIVFMVGHGQLSELSPTFVLPGPDLTAEALSQWLEGLRAENQVVLNLSASSGAFLKALAKKGRVNVAANAATEFMEPVFAEFFLRGLESRRADGAGAAQGAGAKDGVVTLLEAYNWASIETPRWITRLRTKLDERGQVPPDAAWRVDGKESVEIFRKLGGGQAGQLGARRLAPDSDAAGPEEPVRVRPKGNPDPWITGRRVIVEHALLEDCGEAEGVSTLAAPEDQPEYVPAAGQQDGEQGHRARRVVLGQAELLAK